MNKRSYKDQSTSRKKATPSSTTPIQQASWKHYFQDGRQAFQESQYKEALDYFNQAVLLEPAHLTLLDSRAATYERLQQWGLAIQDAKTMVKLSPTSSKGYLRYGKLLSSHYQRHASAAKVYQRGCDMVDPNDARYALLMSLKQDMEAHIAKAKQRRQGQRDPLGIMPYDVLDLIFSYLPFHRRVACMLVSRTWRRFLVTWSGMWRNMDLVTGALRHNNVSRKTLAQYLLYTQGRHLRRFSLSADKAKTDYALQLLIDQDCHYLEYLGLAHANFTSGVFSRTLRLMGKNLTHLYLDQCDHGFTNLFDLLATTCPRLSHLYYGSDIRETPSLNTDNRHIYSHLKLLHLVVDLPQETLEMTLGQCPHLSHLILPRTSLPPAWILNHAPSQLNVYHQAPPSVPPRQVLWDASSAQTTEQGLSSFTVVSSTLDDATFTAIMQTHHPTLETLNLNHSTGFTTNAWRILPPLLRTLELKQCAVSESDLLCFMASCPLLERVVVSCNQAVSNQVMHAMPPSLQWLDVSACPTITGSGVRSVVDRCSLKKLIANDCLNVQPDAIQHARTVLGRAAVDYTFGQQQRK